MNISIKFYFFVFDKNFFPVYGCVCVYVYVCVYVCVCMCVCVWMGVGLGGCGCGCGLCLSAYRKYHKNASVHLEETMLILFSNKAKKI